MLSNMTQKQKFYIGTAVVLLVGTGIFIAVNRKKKTAQIKVINDILDQKVATAGQKQIPAEQIAALPDGKWPVKIGDKSKKVLALQQALNRNYGTTVDVDGSFGQGLYKALCDKYFNYGCTVLGAPVYVRQIEQSDFDQINTHKN